MASFEEILNTPASEIKAPQPLPVGTYHCLIDGPPALGKSRNQNDFFTFKFKVLSPMGDVDAREAAEQQVIGKVFSGDWYVTEAAAWRLVEFLQDHCGIEGNSNRLKAMIAEAPGKQVLVKLRHEPSADGKRLFHRIDSTAHV